MSSWSFWKHNSQASCSLLVVLVLIQRECSKQCSETGRKTLKVHFNHEFSPNLSNILFTFVFVHNPLEDEIKV